MTGKADEGARGEADVAGWLAGVFAALSAEVDRAVRQLVETVDKPGDMAATDRRARAIANMARAAKLVASLKDKPRAARSPSSETEDDMSEEDRDITSAQEEAELRAELKSRLDHLNSVYERKRMDAEACGGGPEGGDQGDAEAA